MHPSYPPTRTDLPHANRFPPSPRDQKSASEVTVLRNSFVAAGLLAILQFNEDLSVATVLAVERLGYTAHRGGRSAGAGLNLNIGLAFIHLLRYLQALRKIANLARRADIGQKRLDIFLVVLMAICVV